MLEFWSLEEQGYLTVFQIMCRHHTPHLYPKIYVYEWIISRPVLYSVLFQEVTTSKYAPFLEVFRPKFHCRLHWRFLRMAVNFENVNSVDQG